MVTRESLAALCARSCPLFSVSNEQQPGDGKASPRIYITPRSHWLLDEPLVVVETLGQPHFCSQILRLRWQ